MDKGPGDSLMQRTLLKAKGYGFYPQPHAICWMQFWHNCHLIPGVKIKYVILVLQSKCVSPTNMSMVSDTYMLPAHAYAVHTYVTYISPLEMCTSMFSYFNAVFSLPLEKPTLSLECFTLSFSSSPSLSSEFLNKTYFKKKKECGTSDNQTITRERR